MHRIESLENRRLLAAAQPFALLGSQNFLAEMDEAIELGGRLFFSAFQTNGFGRESLYVSSGDGSNAVRLFESVGSTLSSAGNAITAPQTIGDWLYFFGSSEAGDGLFRTDGTITQTVKLLRVGSVNTLPEFSWTLNDKLYFFWGDSLYESDGSAAGTAPIAANQPWFRSCSETIDGRVYLGTEGALWQSTATNPVPQILVLTPEPAETRGVPREVTMLGDRLLFTSVGYSTSRLYAFTPATGALGQIHVEPTGLPFESYIAPRLVRVGDRVLFESRHPNSYEDRIFSTDGTQAGTHIIAGELNGAPGPELVGLQSAGAGLATFMRIGEGLYATDGTAAGTRPIGSRSSGSFAQTFSFDGRSYYSFFDGMMTRFLISDGTAAGTRFVSYPSPFRISTYRGQAGLNDRLVLAIEKWEGTLELWSFDPAAPTGDLVGRGFFDYTRDGIAQSFEPSLPGRAYLDLNRNGEADMGEPSQQTADYPSNDYRFEGLVTGEYDVRFLPYGIYENRPITSPAGGTARVAVTSGATVRADFGTHQNETAVVGRVYDDANDNGQLDVGEAGLAGLRVYLDLNGNGLEDSSGEPSCLTDASGFYAFSAALLSLPTGSRAVRVNVPVDRRQTDPADRAARYVNIVAGAVASAAPIGLTQATPLRIGGALWNDWNENLIVDGDDTPFNRYAPAIWADVNNNGTFDAADKWAYAQPSGDFELPAISAGRYIIHCEARERVVDLPGGGTISNLQFLLFDPASSPPPGRIDGRIWNDRNGNGLRDADEPAVNGVLIHFDDNGTGVLEPSERRDRADVGGAFAFPNTAAGAVRLRVVVPTGWTLTTSATSFFNVTVMNGQVVLPDIGLQSPDTIAPRVESVRYDLTAGGFRIRFSEDVSATLDPADFFVRRLGQSQGIPSAQYRLDYDLSTQTALLRLANPAPAAGHFSLLVRPGTYFDASGNAGAGSSADYSVVEGDINADGRVDFSDLLIAAQNFGRNGGIDKGDMDRNGRIDFDDLLLLAQHYSLSSGRPALKAMDARSQRRA